MTTQDCVVIAALILAGVAGFAHGALRQLTHLVAWVALLVVPYLLAAPIGHFIADTFDTPYAVAFAIGGIVLGIGAHVLTRVAIGIAGFVIRKAYDAIMTIGESKEEKEKEEQARFRGSLGDRLLGMALGLLKWGSVLWVGISGLVVLDRPLREHGTRLAIESSWSFGLCEKHNAFNVYWAKDIAKVSAALKRLQAQAGGSTRTKDAEALSDDDRVKAIQKDQALKKALTDGDFRALIRSNDVLSLLTDPGAMRRVVSVATEGKR